MLNIKNQNKEKLSFLFVCNGIDEVTLSERNIKSDSPAATKKIFKLCEVLSKNGVDASIISMGRGKANGSYVSYKKKYSKINDIEIIYAPYSHIYIWSQVLSVIGLAQIVYTFRKK
ncbi:hypothetical protein N8Z49_02240 [Amylibacter sp.]|nr:hypothetical protein [Amylibacter sp.]